MSYRSFQVPVLILLTFFVWSCATPNTQDFKIPPGAKLTLKSIDIQASPSISSRKLVPLDIIYAYDKASLRRLNGFTANGWFSVKETKLIDWKGQIELVELNVKPGEKQQITSFPQRAEAPLAVVFFARYPNNAVHRYIIVGGSQITVQLEDALFIVGGK